MSATRVWRDDEDEDDRFSEEEEQNAKELGNGQQFDDLKEADEDAEDYAKK